MVDRVGVVADPANEAVGAPRTIQEIITAGRDE
jgi:hypothetical protein